MTPVRRYRRALADLRSSRGERCEGCGASTRSAHHIIPVSATGIAAELVYEPANLMLLCNDCHSLMHPGYRRYSWNLAGEARGKALGR